ncbi:cation diffusion facilitator family transporter [Herbiconiux sp. VKM Ac-2851]|uniref:cation diffusion facilitator family transporter n=1 Tax=Herbiconiux sp. VKM Ac-2851 TaxID=2739025 RepID=UPI0015678D56|nr:cation diffusion facilitator family transporter [Herbiconiux sp. VKM Ac-2851]NQX35758.1 cation diffusion facilitator family transporter [Herbiconiux sp. VKM Ac-2851]
MTVVIAFLANILVAAAKSVVAALTGSASMLAEAAHSWADAGNEIFLLIADRRAEKKQDPAHPLGYGRDAYIFSLFAAFGIFTVGAVVSVYHGIQSLAAPEAVEDYTLNYIVLAVAFVLEGFSLTQSVMQGRRAAKQYGRGFFDYVVNGSNTTLRSVFFEDTAALLGLVIAAGGIGLHQATGDPVWDAIGSILIGLLLGGVALLLISRNRRYLLGAGPSSSYRAETGRMLLAHPEIQRVTSLYLEFSGPGKLFLVAAVDLVGDQNEDGVAAQLRRLETDLEREELIGKAVLTLAVSDEPSLDFAA